MKKKKLLDTLMSRPCRKAIKTFFVWMILFALIIFLFIKFVYFVKENMPVALKPTIKDEKQDTDMGELIVEEKEKPIVGNISVT